ncbi:MAG: PorV/PorQ family protein [Elusimicrobiota bacterium]
MLKSIWHLVFSVLQWFLLITLSSYHLITCLYGFASQKDRGTSGAQFLKVGAGARAVGMGEAFSGIADDVSTIYWNPSGLANLEKPAFEAMYSKWFQDMNYQFIAFAYPTSIGTFGLSLSGFDVDDIEKREEDTAEPISEFGATDIAYTISYSKKLMEGLATGVNIKFISQGIDDEAATAFASDIGALYKTPIAKLTAGLVLQNFGSKLKFVDVPDPLPTKIKLGFGYRLLADKLTVGLDINAPNDNQIYASIGAEYISKIVADLSGSIRAGYKTGQETGNGFDWFTTGAGLGYKNFNFNFAWVPYGDLGSTFRYSLVVRF